MWKIGVGAAIPRLFSVGAVFIALASCAVSERGMTTTEQVYLSDSESWSLTSEVTGQDYRIFVALPPDYSSSEKAYGVVYVTDANMQFATVVETARNLASEGAVPDQIIVGIGYPIQPGWPALMPLRSFDLTPTFSQDWQDNLNQHLEDRGEPLIQATGNADAFSRFIKQELIPEVSSRYRVSIENRTFFGHSFGALFGTYVLLNDPKIFDKYILASPSYWWDDEVAFNFERAYANEHTNLPATVFLSAGEFEQTEALAQWKGVDNVYRMENLLNSRKYPDMHVSVHVFEGETHMSVVPAAISRGLRYVAKGAKN